MNGSIVNPLSWANLVWYTINHNFPKSVDDIFTIICIAITPHFSQLKAPNFTKLHSETIKPRRDLGPGTREGCYNPSLARPTFKKLPPQKTYAGWRALAQLSGRWQHFVTGVRRGGARERQPFSACSRTPDPCTPSLHIHRGTVMAVCCEPRLIYYTDAYRYIRVTLHI